MAEPNLNKVKQALERARKKTKPQQSPAKKVEPKTTYPLKKVCFFVREDLWTYIQNLAYTERKQIADMIEDIIVEYQKNHSDKELIERPSGFRQR